MRRIAANGEFAFEIEAAPFGCGGKHAVEAVGLQFRREQISVIAGPQCAGHERFQNIAFAHDERELGPFGQFGHRQHAAFAADGITDHLHIVLTGQIDFGAGDGIARARQRLPQAARGRLIVEPCSDSEISTTKKAMLK